MKRISFKVKVWLAVLTVAIGGQTLLLVYRNQVKAAGISGVYYASESNILLVSGSGFGSAQGLSTVTVDGTSLGAASSWGDGDIYYTAPAKSSGTLTLNIDGGGSYSAAISQLSTYTSYPSDPDLSSPDLVSYYPFDSDFSDKKSGINLTPFNQKLYGSGKFGGKYEAIYPLIDPAVNVSGWVTTLRIGNQIILVWDDDVSKYSISSDNGVTWGAPVAAPAAPYGLPKQMSNGQWLYLKSAGFPSPSFQYCHSSNVTITNVFNPPDLVCGAVDAAAWIAMSGGWGNFYTQWNFEAYSGGRVIWPVYKYSGLFGAGMIYSEDYGYTWGFKVMSQSHIVNGLSLTSDVTAGQTTIGVNDASQLTESGVVKLTNGGTNETVSYGAKSGNTLQNVRKGNSGEYLVGSELNDQPPGVVNSYVVAGTTVMQGFTSPGEPSVVVDPNNQNHLIMFERHEGGAGSYILKAESTDFGDSWTLIRTIYIGDNLTGSPVRGNNNFAFWTASAGGAQGRIYIFARHWSGTKYFYSDDSGTIWHGSNAQVSTKTDNNYTLRVGDTWQLANDMDNNSYLPATDGSGLWLFRKWAIDDDASPGTGTIRATPMANVFFSYTDTTSGKNLAYANSAYDARQNLSTYSLDFWANIRQTHRNIDGTIISRMKSDGTKANYDIKIVGNGANQNKIQFRQYNDLTSSWNTIYSTAALSNNSWYHVVATYDGAKIRLYLNGILNSELTSTSTHSGTETLQIGYDAGTDMMIFRGQLDNLKIWGKALSSAEVLSRYNWGSPVITSLLPTSVTVGNQFTVYGSGFGAIQGSNYLTVNGIVAEIVYWSETIIIARAPNNVGTNLPVVVNVSGFGSNSASLTVTAAPTAGVDSGATHGRSRSSRGIGTGSTPAQISAEIPLTAPKGGPKGCDPNDPNCNRLSKILSNEALTTKINIGVLAAILIIFLILAILNFLANLLPFLRFSQIFAYLVKGRNRKNAKGLVYEAATGLPIPEIKVLLFRARDQKLQATAVSNKEGKFALAVPPGEEYYLETSSFGFDQIKESRFRKIQRLGLKYSNNYFGQHFSSRGSAHYFDRSIPLVANANASPQSAAIHKIEVISKILRVLNAPLLIVGFSFALIVFSYSKSLINYIVVGLYIVIFIYYIVRYFVALGQSHGLVYNRADKTPIDLAIVRAISETNGKLVKTTVSDNSGRFVLALPRGYYNIVVTKVNMQQQEITKSRVKSTFSPTKEKIGLSKAAPEPLLPKSMPSTLQASSSETPVRTFLDSTEIIERNNQRADIWAKLHAPK